VAAHVNLLFGEIFAVKFGSDLFVPSFTVAMVIGVSSVIAEVVCVLVAFLRVFQSACSIHSTLPHTSPIIRVAGQQGQHPVSFYDPPSFAALFGHNFKLFVGRWNGRLE
jgi:hypothetical protein